MLTDETSMTTKLNRVSATVLTLSIVLGAGAAHAAGQVSEVFTSQQPATPFRFDIDGQTYTWGANSNQVMDGFAAGEHTYFYQGQADQVQLRRDNIADVSTGNPCGVFVERQGASANLLQANYPSDGSNTGNCDMAGMIASRVINRGALDLFSNTGPNPKNVERVDYFYEYGVSAPVSQDALAQAGHVVAEKSGNNAIQIAAITALDVLGQPSAYGPLVRVNGNGCSDPDICYGITSLRHNYAFFQNNSLVPQGFPSFLKFSTESVGMAFVSAEQLGLSLGQRYYGFSYFPEDVDQSVHNLTDPASFPNDTNDEHILFGDGADIYGGVAGHFVSSSLSVASGAVFKDENSDGQFDANEAGISNISISLHQDIDANNVFDDKIDAQLGDSLESDRSGVFYLSGLNDGSYFLVLDNNDADIPPGLSLADGAEVLHFVVDGNDPENLNFSFTSSENNQGNTGGSTTTDGSTTDGATTDGATTDGATTDGATTDGATTDGATTDGATTDGATTDGSTTDGSTTDGSTTDGSTTDGATTDGATTDGATTDGATTDGATTDGATTDGSSTGGFVVIEDGSETSAVADSAVVNQGDTLTIDVLSNDIDGPGDGLTIVSTSASSNAAITIENGQIVYKPNFGFIGQDSFLYVVQDSQGTQDTGTVSVSVERYSDINNNGLNDFIECNCENLTLEVGVTGNALGGLSHLLLMFMSLVGLMRIYQLAVSRAAGANV